MLLYEQKAFGTKQQIIDLYMYTRYMHVHSETNGTYKHLH